MGRSVRAIYGRENFEEWDFSNARHDNAEERLPQVSVKSP